MVLARPFMVRQSKVPFPNGYDYIFNDLDTSKVVRIFGMANTGEYEAKINSFLASAGQFNAPNSFQNNSDITNSSLEASRSVSLRVSTNNNQKYDEFIFSQPSEDNFSVNVKKANEARTPPAAYVGNIMSNPAEDAQKLSILIKDRRTEKLYKYLRLLYPDLVNLQLLQEGGVPVIYALFSDDSMQQTILLGGGFQMMLSVALAMMTIKDGVFLFDEIDNTIHHSLLKDFWSLVARLADDTNGQVFSVTHSRECIGYAVEGFQLDGRLADLAYFRLEEGLNKTNCISYDGSDLVEALSSDWELR